MQHAYHKLGYDMNTGRRLRTATTASSAVSAILNGPDINFKYVGSEERVLLPMDYVGIEHQVSGTGYSWTRVNGLLNCNLLVKPCQLGHMKQKS